MELKPGYKQTEMGVIPEDWVVDELTTVCERISVGLATSVTKHYRAQGVPIIRNLNIKNGYFDSSEMLYLDPEFAKKNLSKAARALDVLTVHTGSNLGLTCVLPFEFHNCLTFTTLITTPTKSKLDPYFLCYHMSSSQGKNEMQRLQVGGGKGNLNTSDLKKYYFAFPSSKAEQTAIANALSDADALIQSFIRLIAKKRQIKQGAMQTLLNPYENGRLKAGRVVKKLGELCSPSSVRINPRIEKKIYKCIELEHIDQVSGRLLGHVSSNNQFSQKTLFKKGDVLFGKLRPYLKKYLFAEFDGVCSTEIWVLKSENNVSSLWLYYLVQSDQIVEAANQSTGTKMPRAEWRVVKNTEINFPSSLNEQIRIATILSDMDTEIAALEAKLAKYRQIKQGMMQNLLTGKIRLI